MNASPGKCLVRWERDQSCSSGVLQKTHAGEEEPCRKAEEGRSLVFLRNRKKVLLLDHSEQGTKGGRKSYKLGPSCSAMREVIRVGYLIRRAGFEEEKNDMN